MSSRQLFSTAPLRKGRGSAGGEERGARNGNGYCYGEEEDGHRQVLRFVRGVLKWLQLRKSEKLSKQARVLLVAASHGSRSPCFDFAPS